ncbi:MULTISPECIES: sporulation protein [Pseudoalteromonas]|uniref:Sporulation protein n=1 Tax=Pseudoalteromonas amylolytica TaxID=1859457 RepID=A0A1S1MVJ8_9GAMM|nr:MULTISPECIES: sporulation protein [Pseudoalteromonas]OHU88162.1 sporulation protein [Pseudoalteromonas sp. JW3]OHU91602.1 sporulation protein [Pseudoalteromonas amylolytica]
MSFFKKVLSSVGIGAAKIDAVLDHHQAAPGDELTGVIKVVGGSVAQEINKIDLDVVCNYTVEVETENDDVVTEVREYTLARFVLDEKFTIESEQHKEFPFVLALSEDTPLTVGHSKTWLETNLDIDMALDKSDKDYVHVVPNTLQQAVIDTLESLGFKLYEADCEGIDSMSFAKLPFVQELEFKTIGGQFHGHFDEVEVVFFNRGEQLEIIFEIDRKARGLVGFFKEAMDLDESKARLLISSDDLPHLADMINHLLEQHC